MAILSDSTVDQRYKYWRLHIMVSMYIGYAGFYLTRKNFTYAMPAMIADLGWDKVDIGMMGTLFYLTYGCSKFISGMISDRSNPRYFMGIGLIATGIINICFGFSSSIMAFTLLWIANAWFQGWGWPACSKLLTTWYSRSERGLWWSCWNTAHNVGGALIPLLVGFLTVHYGWRYGFFVPGIVAIIIGIGLCWRLRNKPTAMGLPSVGLWRHDHLEMAQENEGIGLTQRQVLFKYVLTNKYLWLLAMSYVLVYIVRTAINDWGNLYLTEQHHYSLLSANGALSLFEVGGFLGSLVGGWGSDKLFGGNRGPMILLFSMGIFLAVAALWLMPVTNYILQAGCFFAIGFFVFGPQMLIGMAAAECSHKDSVGAATGFVGLFAYMGAALAGYPLAIIMNHYHWTGFFVVISVAAALIGLLLLPFLKAQTSSAVSS
ncbi:MFS transporter [Photobacterium iliopiscarium]|uniref:MFS transporter family glucose-6-phosphate receptor UhpC n=1 Tax=Photobacterium iliopiscarium TaxID=56192 RepID=A0ABX5GWV1_9GAMM|nr:MFS transporter [Photobacterium iliopiscarium]KJG26527.1 MFS transporter [Photobacterium iliopiscarium]MCD9468618.1 MFS transporter family glucose-6-phosphate receptor UhpC [Photobacterium iliopiscarium]MCD9488608.1 MFS transporter [Photobacterium iliopiscarium]MCF2245349.1 MFS transporter [Photobacterium iliopiscarium]PSW99536.1 MFS transporter family glucose-6-phosphate receptor UhpC [Photobacterium iliopiscarium]